MFVAAEVETTSRGQLKRSNPKRADPPATTAIMIQIISGSDMETDSADTLVDLDGTAVGLTVGGKVGEDDDGFLVGTSVGAAVGAEVGIGDGSVVGVCEGAAEGTTVGFAEGACVYMLQSPGLASKREFLSNSVIGKP